MRRKRSILRPAVQVAQMSTITVRSGAYVSIDGRCFQLTAETTLLGTAHDCYALRANPNAKHIFADSAADAPSQ